MKIQTDSFQINFQSTSEEMKIRKFEIGKLILSCESQNFSSENVTKLLVCGFGFISGIPIKLSRELYNYNLIKNLYPEIILTRLKRF